MRSARVNDTAQSNRLDASVSRDELFDFLIRVRSILNSERMVWRHFICNLYDGLPNFLLLFRLLGLKNLLLDCIVEGDASQHYLVFHGRESLVLFLARLGTLPRKSDLFSLLLFYVSVL